MPKIRNKLVDHSTLEFIYFGVRLRLTKICFDVIFNLGQARQMSVRILSADKREDSAEGSSISSHLPRSMQLKLRFTDEKGSDNRDEKEEEIREKLGQCVSGLKRRERD